jgi:hypothetical protein
MIYAATATLAISVLTHQNLEGRGSIPLGGMHFFCLVHRVQNDLGITLFLIQQVTVPQPFLSVRRF